MTSPEPEVPCPNIDAHTLRPAGYVAQSEWAEAMGETHSPRKCPGCGRWAVWEPYVPGTPPLDPDQFESICIVGWNRPRAIATLRNTR